MQFNDWRCPILSISNYYKLYFYFAIAEWYSIFIYLEKLEINAQIQINWVNRLFGGKFIVMHHWTFEIEYIIHLNMRWNQNRVKIIIYSIRFDTIRPHSIRTHYRSFTYVCMCLGDVDICQSMVGHHFQLVLILFFSFK